MIRRMLKRWRAYRRLVRKQSFPVWIERFDCLWRRICGILEAGPVCEETMARFERYANLLHQCEPRKYRWWEFVG